MNFWRTFSHGKVALLLWRFFLLQILLKTLDMVVLEESSLVLHFPKTLLVDLKMSSRVKGMFCICLVLHVLSWKYLAKSFGAFFTLKFSSNTGTNFCTFWLLHSFWCNSSWKFSVIGLNSGKFLSLYLGPFS